MFIPLYPIDPWYPNWLLSCFCTILSIIYIYYLYIEVIRPIDIELFSNDYPNDCPHDIPIIWFCYAFMSPFICREMLICDG